MPEVTTSSGFLVSDFFRHAFAHGRINNVELIKSCFVFLFRLMFALLNSLVFLQFSFPEIF